MKQHRFLEVASLAADMQAGGALAMQHVNQQGGVLNQQYKLIFADSACDPGKAVEAVKQLIEVEKVSALVGPVCSGATLRQARSVSIPAGVVTLSVASASSLISRLRDNDLVFRTAIADPFKGEVMAEYAIENGIKEIAVSFSNDAYNSGIAEVFRKAFKAKGGIITANQVHQANQSDYRREVEALVARSEHIALFAYYGASGTQLLKDAFATNKVGQVFATDGMLSQDLIDALGAEALSSTRIFNNSSNESRKAFKIWKDHAETASIPAKGPFGANSYDAAFMIALAIQAVGSADKAGISAGLRAIAGPMGEVIFPGEFEKAKHILSEGGKINYDGGSGPVDFDKNGDVTGFIGVSQVKDGAWESTLFHK
ncbi:MAG: ABC transporter substrate-binding protein [Gammaproteobacteria bacterium]|nr:ABC transporter substrate-binding protein [Gammaproteobacteria bacterium]